MLRARFFQNTYIVRYGITVRENKEYDVEYDLGLEMYLDEDVDILNPFEHSDLLRNLDRYEDDWLKFVEYTKREGV